MDGCGDHLLITINSDGSFTVIPNGLNYPSFSITRNSYKSYTVSDETGTITFDFSSDTQATVDFVVGSELLTIIKK